MHIPAAASVGEKRMVATGWASGTGAYGSNWMGQWERSVW